MVFYIIIIKGFQIKTNQDWRLVKGIREHKTNLLKSRAEETHLKFRLAATVTMPIENCFYLSSFILHLHNMNISHETVRQYKNYTGC